MSKYAADDDYSDDGRGKFGDEDEPTKPKLKGGDPGQARIPTGAKCVIDPAGPFSPTGTCS